MSHSTLGIEDGTVFRDEATGTPCVVVGIILVNERDGETYEVIVEANPLDGAFGPGAMYRVREVGTDRTLVGNPLSTRL